jgi:hypothetical protein
VKELVVRKRTHAGNDLDNRIRHMLVGANLQVASFSSNSTACLTSCSEMWNQSAVVL